MSSFYTHPRQEGHLPASFSVLTVLETGQFVSPPQSESDGAREGRDRADLTVLQSTLEFVVGDVELGALHVCK